jgi:hypothetical protein
MTPPPSYVPIDPEVLRRLYVEERLTSTQIARRLDCAEITVLRRLRRFGIPARPRGPLPGHRDHANPAASRARSIWSPETAYVVGLIATDGNLSRRRYGLALSSNDVDLLETARRCLQLTNSITRYTNSRCYHIQWRDRRFYDWLVDIGLTPAKSLTLGALAVPDEYFADFFRGCIDGDGTVLVYTDRYHTAKKERYVYERLYVSLVSASRPFLDWMRARIRTAVGVDGFIDERRKEGQRSLWRLRYAKADSIRLIGWMYYAPNVPCLARKRAKAERFLSPLGYSALPPAGRPRVGWLYNKPLTQNAGVAKPGIRVRFKIGCPQGRAGSNPASGTIP